jgi:hypothetical protein
LGPEERREPRLIPAAVAAVTLAAGLGLFVWVRGPVRGLGGDVLIVVFLDALLATARLGDARMRVAGVFALGVFAEAFQATGLVPKDAHWLLHLTLGSTADPLDLLAYAVGAALAWVAERRLYATR